MPLKKIISGGQPGVERAALDVAIKLDIPHGGWISKGRRVGDGMLPDKYQLLEMDASSRTDCVQKNVLASDATLVISVGVETGDAALSRNLTRISGRHYQHIDLSRVPVRQGASIVSSWIRLKETGILNVTGPGVDSHSNIYKDTLDVFEKALWINRIKNIVDAFLPSPVPFFQIVEDVVDGIVSNLSFKTRVMIANLSVNEIKTLQYGLDLYISSRQETAYKGDTNNTVLFADQGHTVIMKRLWNRLRETYALKIIQ